jgi:phosphatidylserine decarboxylase
MKFHKEGIPSLLLILILWTIIHLALGSESMSIVRILADLVFGFLLVVVLQFFRNPIRKFISDDQYIIAPADGKVVVIENVFEPEVLKKECKQISIFMSPINVHINRYPVSGKVTYAKYHPGKFLVAWHPKSSTENERTSVCVRTNSGKDVFFRQIAGALARRIVMYSKEGDVAQQQSEFGFIKFGSRVDIFIPIESEVLVSIDTITTGGITKIAKLS